MDALEADMVGMKEKMAEVSQQLMKMNSDTSEKVGDMNNRIGNMESLNRYLWKL